MDPNIITIDSDDSNDATSLQYKNKQSPLVIVHRVINTNTTNTSKYSSVLQNIEHFNHKLPKNQSQQPNEYPQNIENINIEDNFQYNSRFSKNDEIFSLNRIFMSKNNETLNNNSEIIDLHSPEQSNNSFVNLLNVDVDVAVDVDEENQIVTNTETSEVSERNNMHPQQNYEFPVPEHTIAWSRNTSNFIKQSMNSVMQSNNVVLLQNPPNAHQSSIPRPHLSNTQEYLQKNVYEPDIRNYQNVYHSPTSSFSCINNTNYFQPGYYNNGIMMNNFVPNNNFWMRVRLEEIPERGEVVAQYFYNNETQTPITIQNNFQVSSNTSNSQFIDISNVALNDDASNDCKIDANNTSEEDKKTKISVPPFLKRTRKNNSCKNTLNNSSLEDGDVIFVGEFKNDSDEPNKVNHQDIELSKTSLNLNLTGLKKIDGKHIKKRPRKCYEAVEPRRNPKRQVQVNKEFYKLIDDIIWEDAEKENKVKKTVYKTSYERIEKKPVRYSPRIQTNCGAVYSPPSPLTIDHIRKWPTEGMHEKPEYNPKTGKIEPFDYVTRNITDTYNTRKISETKCTDHEEIKPETKISEKHESINVLSHDMLHHMISYVATVIQMEKTNIHNNNNNHHHQHNHEESKVEFLNDLGLTENDNILHDENCDNVKDILKNIINVKDCVTDFKNIHNLKELLKHTMIMYCITNEVDQSDLVKYIDSLKPEEIINTSNELIDN